MPVISTGATNPQIITELYNCIFQLTFYERKLDLRLSGG